MNIGSIDSAATNGTSWLHGAAPAAKLIAFSLVLAAVIASWNVLVVFALALLVSAATVSSGVRLRLAFGLAAYPALFALVFALASAPDAMTGTTIVLKAMVAALAAVTVVVTTPYPYVFAPLQRVMPSLVGDAMLMTYRSTFMMLEKFSNLLRAVKLRSGLGRRDPLRAARASAQALGGLLLYSFDLSQREYDIMRLRGYERRLHTSPPVSASRGLDLVLVTTAAFALAASVLWRVGAGALNPYSWIAPVLPAALVAGAAFRRWKEAR